MVQNAERERMKISIDEMKELLAEQINLVEKHDENLIQRIVEKITVYDEHLAVESKSRIIVDIRR